MQVATALTESGLRLTEPVRSLLDRKGHAVWSVSPQDTVFSAIETMSERRVGALVVLMDGQPVGIVSERDYARKVVLMGRNSHSTAVREIMTSPVLYVTPEQSIEACMRLMTSRRIRHVPVVEGQKVVGVLSIGDIVNWMLSAQQQAIHDLHNYIAGSYPA